jgi:hypothetical protein
MNRLNRDHVIGILSIALGVAIRLVAHTFPKATTGASDLTGPAFYPKLLALVFIGCGIAEILSGMKKETTAPRLKLRTFWATMTQPGPLNILIITGLVLGFIFFLETLGFIVYAYLTLFILMWRFRVPLLKNIAYSAVLVIILMFIFGKIFKIYLPSGVLDYLGL